MTRTDPRIILNGAIAPQLSRDLTSLTVHAVGRGATAEIEILGSSAALPLMGADLETTTVAVWLAEATEEEQEVEEECFSGRLTGIELRMPAGVPPTTALLAEGAAIDGTGRPPVPLRVGAEIVSASIRREAQGVTARCVANAPSVQWGSEVHLITDDASIGGSFQVVELWHRFDAMRGLTVEFIASR